MGKMPESLHPDLREQGQGDHENHVTGQKDSPQIGLQTPPPQPEPNAPNGNGGEEIQATKISIDDHMAAVVTDEVTPHESTPEIIAPLTAGLSRGDNAGDESSDSGEPSPKELGKEAAKKVMDYADYIELMERRVASLEEQMKSSEGPKKKKKDSKTNEKRVPAIPKLRHVDWASFKNQIKDNEEIYAIEALVGEVKYYYQRNKQQSQEASLANDRAIAMTETEQIPQVNRGSKDSRARIDRIRINSVPVLMILAEILDLDLSEEPTVHLYPFKALARHHEQIRAYLDMLESRWASREDMEVADQKDHLSVVGNHGPEYEINHNDQSQADSFDPGVPLEEALSDDGDKRPEAAKLLDSAEAMRDLRCLVHFMDEEIGDPDRYRKPDPPSRILFRDLWYLFKPGDEVYIPIHGRSAKDQRQSETAQKSSGRSQHKRYQDTFKVLNVWGGRPNLRSGDDDTGIAPKQKVNPFWIECYYLDFNGKRFAATSHNFLINPFEGEKEITNLEFFPLTYVSNHSERRQELLQRGKLFVELSTAQYRLYRGPTVVGMPCGCFPASSLPAYSDDIESEVVVDFVEAIRDDFDWAPFTKTETEPGKIFREVEEELDILIWKDRGQKELDGEKEDSIFDDYIIDSTMTAEFEANEPILKSDFSQPITADKLREEDLMLLPPRVLAYVFRKQYFAALRIEHLEPVVKPYKQGWKDLQLRKGQKQVLRSLVKTHLTEKRSKTRDGHKYDIVQGKGQGLIVLLHGVPGVGKTSTAETVAESESKPLLSITCGDLGLTAESVEKALDHKFHLASTWDCILLLDEADVFLAKRTHNDIQRNALVSVFLRVLEYYTGILFLTTNRVGAFDDAFKSRIHLALYYPPLDIHQTKKIWEVNLERTLERKEPLLVADKAEILAYAESHFYSGIDKGTAWNGRQIRNAFQTATALAEFEAFEHQAKAVKAGKRGQSVPVLARLTQKHFDIVAQASFTFDEYLTSVHDDDDLADRAKAARERDDAFPSENVTVKTQRVQSRRTNTNTAQPEIYDQPAYQGQEAAPVKSSQRRPSAKPGQVPSPRPSTVRTPRKPQQQQMYLPVSDGQAPLAMSDPYGSRFSRPSNAEPMYNSSPTPYYIRPDMVSEHGSSQNFQPQPMCSPQRFVAPRGQENPKQRALPIPPSQVYSDDNEDSEDGSISAEDDD